MMKENNSALTLSHPSEQCGVGKGTGKSVAGKMRKTPPLTAVTDIVEGLSRAWFPGQPCSHVSPPNRATYCAGTVVVPI